MTFIVVGVDGGGSKTRVLVADETGSQLGEVVGPGSAVRPGQAERSADVITAASNQVQVRNATNNVVKKTFTLFDPSFVGGVFAD